MTVFRSNHWQASFGAAHVAMLRRQCSARQASQKRCLGTSNNRFGYRRIRDFARARPRFKTPHLGGFKGILRIHFYKSGIIPTGVVCFNTVVVICICDSQIYSRPRFKHQPPCLNIMLHLRVRNTTPRIPGEAALIVKRKLRVEQNISTRRTVNSTLRLLRLARHHRCALNRGQKSV